jgi:hypothetical protein
MRIPSISDRWLEDAVYTPADQKDKQADYVDRSKGEAGGTTPADPLREPVPERPFEDLAARRPRELVDQLEALGKLPPRETAGGEGAVRSASVAGGAPGRGRTTAHAISPAGDVLLVAIVAHPARSDRAIGGLVRSVGDGGHQQRISDLLMALRFDDGSAEVPVTR